jgi:hypothetical protein
LPTTLGFNAQEQTKQSSCLAWSSTFVTPEICQFHLTVRSIPHQPFGLSVFLALVSLQNVAELAQELICNSQD